MEVEYLCRCCYCKKLCDPADFVSKSTSYFKLTKRCLKCRDYATKVVYRNKMSRLCERYKRN
jgi:hypothetical protein